MCLLNLNASGDVTVGNIYTVKRIIQKKEEPPPLFQSSHRHHIKKKNEDGEKLGGPSAALLLDTLAQLAAPERDPAGCYLWELSQFRSVCVCVCVCALCLSICAADATVLVYCRTPARPVTCVVPLFTSDFFGFFYFILFLFSFAGGGVD